MLSPLPILLELLVVIAILRLTLEGRVPERVMLLPFGSERPMGRHTLHECIGPGGAENTPETYARRNRLFRAVCQKGGKGKC